ncbi:unnamed protein product [Brachionus calyciflorus]|uniref:Uncharacterized protein n=1 Tax=Brachionus calyciflorus TaxID=104777 RepID=A0A814I6A7_9BILA|nr:unnamed protein product [Brachionus calyciflorus]
MNFPSLQFSENLATHKILKNSVRIANKFLETVHLKAVFSETFQLDPNVSTERTQNVVIHFQKQSKKSYREQGLAFSWSHRYKRAKAIYVNNTFKKRLNILQKSTDDELNAKKEIKTITVYISFLLLHELAHLLLRWKGILDTPTDIDEAGECLEVALFGGQLRGVFTPNKPWSQNSKFIYIAIEKLKRHGSELYYLSFEDYIEKVYDWPQNTSGFVRLQFCGKPSQKEIIVLKQSDEVVQSETEEGPNQLNVVRRLFNIDVNPCGTKFFRSPKAYCRSE